MEEVCGGRMSYQLIDCFVALGCVVVGLGERAINTPPCRAKTGPGLFSLGAAHPCPISGGGRPAVVGDAKRIDRSIEWLLPPKHAAEPPPPFHKVYTLFSSEPPLAACCYWIDSIDRIAIDVAGRNCFRQQATYNTTGASTPHIYVCPNPLGYYTLQSKLLLRCSRVDRNWLIALNRSTFLHHSGQRQDGTRATDGRRAVTDDARRQRACVSNPHPPPLARPRERASGVAVTATSTNQTAITDDSPP
jgi:hypothetical protein